MKVLQTSLLTGSLIWSTNCASAPVAPSAGLSEAPVRAAGGPKCNEIEAPTLIRRVEPDYPSDVRRQRIEGKVIAEAILTPEGALEDILIVSSPSEALSRLAVTAFRQWRYKAAFCRDWGKPIRVYITVTSTFTLHGKSKEH